MVKTIFAVGINGEFYNEKTGLLPWGAYPLGGDSQHFQDYTRDSVIVMGNNTWDSLPNKLKGRTHAVLSESGQVMGKGDKGVMPDIILKGSLDQVLPELQLTYLGKDIIVIGGLKLVEEAIKYSDEVSITNSVRGYGNCVHINRQQVLEDMYKNGFEVYSQTTYYNESFHLGSNCGVRVWRK